MNMILKGNIIYSKTSQELHVVENGYLVCAENVSKGVFSAVPEIYSNFPVADYGKNIIIPGLCDLHTHAPQYAFRGLGSDMELLDWLNTYAYPEEAKYADTIYADNANNLFTAALSRSATTRVCIYATTHPDATINLMDKLDRTGIVSYVGLVNMDRNCPENLSQRSSDEAIEATEKWIEAVLHRFNNTNPIITPRFIPVCSDELMHRLKDLQVKYNLPLQSHLSENKSEIEWVKKLCPEARTYANAYDRFGLFGGDGFPAIMAHCVWCTDDDKALIRDNSVYVAHCPGSNTNLASGIAPIRDYMNKGIFVGLGSDIAGGSYVSIFRAMSDAIQVSKMYMRLVDNNCKPLTLSEAFYLGTIGGGGFYGKVGSFEEGFEFDAVVIDDSDLCGDTINATSLTLKERLERIVYFSVDTNITAKYVKGEQL